mmetsp:Transcript_81642/g.143974  ORF Transcript_81642/g.143974 Transcript_81642/m.143974 type:complete len:490 (-) Transcript_81642:194-1663(-)
MRCVRFIQAVREAVKRIGATCDSLGGNRRLQLQRLWEKNFLTLRSEAEVAQAAESRGRLQRSGVDLYISDKTALDLDTEGRSHKVTVTRPKTTLQFGARNICIATGSRPNRPAHIPFQKDRIIDSTEITSTLGKGLPKTIAIIGGGIIGVEYATVLASVGVGVSIFCKKERFMVMLPRILRESLLSQLNNLHILLVEDDIDYIEPGDPELIESEKRLADGYLYRFNASPDGRPHAPDTERDLRPTIRCGKRQFKPELVLYSGGRDANSEDLGLEENGVEFAKYGRIAVDQDYMTNVKGVFAIGDVIGGGLASAAAQGGRTVSCSLFAPAAEEEVIEADALSDNVPLTLWTIPEIASVGRSVEELQAKGIKTVADGGPIVVGYARFDELARGRLSGGQGFVQIVAQHIRGLKGRQSVHRIVGIHIIGTGANELIALGGLLVHTKTTCETVTNTPFAAVTLTQLFQLACDDVLCNSPYSSMSKLRSTRMPV